MKPKFIDFWHLYEPAKEYHNRYLACQKLWETMDDSVCDGILKELEHQRSTAQPPIIHEKNPYFFLLDWQPPQPHWLSPKEVGYLLAQHVTLAVCRNPRTNSFGTITKAEAEQCGLEVHHWM